MEEKDFKKLDGALYSLRKLIEMYKSMKNELMYSTPEIIKNVQDSIKELCTLITKETAI